MSAALRLLGSSIAILLVSLVVLGPGCRASNLAGSEGERCSPDKTCNERLTCIGDICVLPPPAAAAVKDQARSKGACAAAADQITKLTVESEEVQKVSAEERQEVESMMKGLEGELAKGCIEKSWDAKTLGCVMSTRVASDLKKCGLDKL